MEVGEAIRILKSAGCSDDVVNHCLAVREVSMLLASKIREKGHEVDEKLVEEGALFHDIGRARTHGIFHGVEGGRILRELGLKRLIPFAESHIGGGIPIEEAKELGLPPKDYLPRSIEEKIVAYADKLVKGGKTISFEESLEEFKRRLGNDHPAIGRLIKLHEEMMALLGGSYPEHPSHKTPWKRP